MLEFNMEPSSIRVRGATKPLTKTWPISLFSSEEMQVCFLKKMASHVPPGPYEDVRKVGQVDLVVIHYDDSHGIINLAEALELIRDALLLTSQR